MPLVITATLEITACGYDSTREGALAWASMSPPGARVRHTGPIPREGNEQHDMSLVACKMQEEKSQPKFALCRSHVVPAPTAASETYIPPEMFRYAFNWFIYFEVLHSTVYEARATVPAD